VIRPCDERDLDAIYAIINEAARAYNGVIPADRYHQPYMPMPELQREAARMTFFGWEEDADGDPRSARSGRLTGVVGFEPVKDVTLVRHCYVLSDRQRQGVGSALTRHVMARTRTRRLLVGTWAAADWAIHFYEKHGFRLLPDADALLRKYWHIPARQRETSVVLGMNTPRLLREPLA
jgi:GNAT superfamily N-acetyltransferase